MNSNIFHADRITQIVSQFTRQFAFAVVLLMLLASLLPPMAIAQQAAGQLAGLKDQEQFSRAWKAASRGERDVFLQLMPALKNYLLYP